MHKRNENAVKKKGVQKRQTNKNNERHEATSESTVGSGVTAALRFAAN